MLPFYIQGEALTIIKPTSGTVARTELGNRERSAIEGGPTDNTGAGKEFNDYGLHHGYVGSGYLDIEGSAGAQARFSFEAPAGTYDIVLRVASSTERLLTLTVDGATTASLSTRTGSFNTWQEKRVTVTVVSDGVHDVILNQVGSAAPNIDAIAVVAKGAATNFAAAFEAVIQAEDLSKVTITDTDKDTSVQTLQTGYTGTGYLDPGNDIGDKFGFAVDAPEAGTYKLVIRYANGDSAGGPRPLLLNVNSSTSTVAFPVTTSSTGDSGWKNWQDVAVTVTLKAGANAISLANTTANGPNIDRITVTGDTKADEDSNLNLLGPDTDVRVGSGAAQSMNFRLEGLDADIKTVQISFDGGATRTTVLPDADGDFSVNTAALVAGTYTVTAYVTDDAANTATDTLQVRLLPELKPFELVIQAEELSKVTITDTDKDTSVQTLQTGYTGTGYLDLGNDIGDKFGFAVNAPEAGTYELVIRYANGDIAGGQRPLLLNVNGSTSTVAFPVTTSSAGDSGWKNWQDVAVSVTLKAGTNAISLANTTANGPNIDRITVSNGVESNRVEQRFEDVIKINFQPAPSQTFQGLPSGYQTPTGYVADTGAAYGNRGNGFSYGWVTETSVADGTANGTTPSALPSNAVWYRSTVPGASNLQKTYAHFEYPPAGTAGARAWEMALQNGSYQITMSIGDTGGAFDSSYVVNLEGKRVTPAWVPANPLDGSQGGGGFRSTLVTHTVQISDGKLTIDSIGGTNTEIQYLEIARLPDLTPTDSRQAHLDYSRFLTPQADSLTQGRVDLAIDAKGGLPVGIDPTSFFVVGVELQTSTSGEQRRGPNISTVDNVKLIETLTGIEVPVTVQITAAADSVTIRPRGDLQENTSYTLKVEDVLDLGVVENFDAPIRQLQDVTATFVTGTKPQTKAQPVAFNDLLLLDGFEEGAYGYTSVEFGPDGRLYIATILGEIHRFDLKADGTLDKASKETLSLDYFKIGNEGDRRGIIGIEFDPTDPNVIWISDNYAVPRQDRAFDTPEFSGQISTIMLGTGGSFTGAKAETYIKGLPRSGGDHLTNSIEFRANPDFGVVANAPKYLLYLTQGSNSAAGAPDSGWGLRPERLLNAAVLEVDPNRTAPTGGFNVQTEPTDPVVADGIDPRYQAPLSGFSANGTYPGYYNPFAVDAVLKVFATGVRNAYDLLWHSNGKLYVPTNGTAGGGITPDDPKTSINEGLSGHPTQKDYFFTVTEGKYYGHPVPLRSEYILNGGNPTAGVDKNEASSTGTPRYPVGVMPDPDYDSANAYSLGLNRSPNGVTEYKSDVFGANLKGAVIFAQFSVGDNVRYILLNEDGSIRLDNVLRRPDGQVIDEYIDPLDIVQHPTTGQLYLMTLDRSSGASQLVLLNPVVENSDPAADIALQSLDTAYFDNRLHFSFIENPRATTASANASRDFKESGTVRISNTGTNPLEIRDAKVDGPFALAKAAEVVGQKIAAGQFLDVTVNFARALYTPTDNLVEGNFSGALRLSTNDAEDPTVTIDLAGFWQARDEGGWEPNVNEVWKLFGFGNAIAGMPFQDSVAGNPLNNRDRYVPVNADEVLSPYWQIAEGYTSAKITQLAAFHGPGGATIGIHAPGNKSADFDEIFTNHQTNDNQTILPQVGSNDAFATRVFDRAAVPDAWAGNDIFGFEVADYSSDPKLNPNGNLAGEQRGYFTRLFKALDADGTVIPNVFLGIQDYAGINYDYNDNMFVVEGVTPVGSGQLMTVTGLDAAAADQRLVFTNIDVKNTSTAITGLGGQQLRNEAVFTITNDGFAPLKVTSYSLPSTDFTVSTIPTTIAAGASVDVTVRFVGMHAGSAAGADIKNAALTINSDAFSGGTRVINLAGIAQEFSENNSEPTVAQIVRAFGYSTNVAQSQLAGGAVKTVGDEVLAPYFDRLDVSKPVDVIQLAAFLQVTNVARLGLHGLQSAAVTQLFAQDDQQSQTVSPDGLKTGSGDSGSVAKASFTPTAPFGLKVSVDGRPTYASWSDPVANDLDPDFGSLIASAQAKGHLLRYFVAKDTAGTVIPGTYIAIQDYPGASNYDYNDHMFLIRNVKPHVLNQSQDANADSINDALQTDADKDGKVAFFDSNDSLAPTTTVSTSTVGSRNSAIDIDSAAYSGIGGKKQPFFRWEAADLTDGPRSDSQAIGSGIGMSSEQIGLAGVGLSQFPGSGRSDPDPATFIDVVGSEPVKLVGLAEHELLPTDGCWY